VRRLAPLLLLAALAACAAPGSAHARVVDAGVAKAGKHRCKAAPKRAARRTSVARGAAVGRPSPPHAARRGGRRAVVRRRARARCVRRHRRPARTPAGAPAAPPSAPGAAPVAAPAPVTGDSPAAADPDAPTLPDAPASSARALQVQSGEFFLRLSRASVLAGDVRVEFDNTRGEDPHDLRLVRADGTGDVLGFDVLPSGAVQARTLRLGAGSWRLFCALPRHADLGMTARLSVTAAAGASFLRRQ